MTIGADGRRGGDVVAIAGEMTVRRAGELKGLLRDALSRSDRVAIDLTAVTEVDLCGLQLLCSAQRTASQLRKSFAFAGPAPEILRRAAREAGFCVRTGCGADDPGMCPWKGGTDR